MAYHWEVPIRLNNARLADSDEVAQAFRYNCAQSSDLKPPCARSLAGR